MIVGNIVPQAFAPEMEAIIQDAELKLSTLLKTPAFLKVTVPGVSGDSLHRIQLLVGMATGISWRSIAGPSRALRIVTARHLYCYAARMYTTYSYKDIGLTIGGRDHTSIIHAYKRTIALLECNDYIMVTAFSNLKSQMQLNDN